MPLGDESAARQEETVARRAGVLCGSTVWCLETTNIQSVLLDEAFSSLKREQITYDIKAG